MTQSSDENTAPDENWVHQYEVRSDHYFVSRFKTGYGLGGRTVKVRDCLIRSIGHLPRN